MATGTHIATNFSFAFGLKKSTSWRQISSVLSSSFPKRILKLLKIILNCKVFCCQCNWQKLNRLVTETKKRAIFQYLKWLNKILRVCLSCSLFDLNKKKTLNCKVYFRLWCNYPYWNFLMKTRCSKKVRKVLRETPVTVSTFK